METDKSLILFPPSIGSDEINRGLELDCTISEGYKTGSTVTGYAVAAGFQVSEHKLRKNRIVRMNVQFGNYIMQGDMIQSMQGSVLSALGVWNAPGVVMQATSGNPRQRAKLVHELLTSIERQGLLCTLVTIIGTYENAVLVDYETNQDAQTVGVLRATLMFELIETIDVESTVRAKVAVSPVEDDTSDSAYDATGQG